MGSGMAVIIPRFDSVPSEQTGTALDEPRAYKHPRSTRSSSSRNWLSWNLARRHSEASHATLMALAESQASPAALTPEILDR